MEQSLQVMSKQERLEYWTAKIIARRSSSMAARAWCQENGISEKTYYYWQRRLFQTLSEQQQAIRQPAYAEITPTPNVQPSGGVAVTVRISGVEAEVYNGADAATGMNIRLCSGHTDSHCHFAGTDCLHRRYFCKLNCLLCLNHFE